MSLEGLLSEFGITDYGYTEEPLAQSYEQFSSWVNQDKHLPLTYLQGERCQKRQDLRHYWPEFQSALVLPFSYDDTRQSLKHFYQTSPSWNGLKIASFTMGFNGHDYHEDLKTLLNQIGERIKERFQLDYKLTLDTAPVLERDLALRSSLGWFGKNSMLINQKAGSFFIIGSLLLSKKLNVPAKSRSVDHCGQCTRCADACPTMAIDPITRTVVAKDCISTFTIEQFHLDTVVPEKMDLSSGFIFGCDICQDICPWNQRLEKKPPFHPHEWSDRHEEIIDFFLNRPVGELSKELEAMSGKQFEKKFKHSSFERSGRRGLLKNLRLYLSMTKGNLKARVE